MAVGNSGFFDLTGTYGMTLRVHWYETYDVATNQSTVTITRLQVRSSEWYGFTYALDGAVSINNVVAFGMNAGSGANLVRTGENPSAMSQFWDVSGSFGSVSGITHREDGSWETSISVSVTGYRYDGGTTTSGWTVTGSMPIALATIPRKSSLSVSDGTLGAEQTLTVTKKTDAFRHTITYACGGASGTICDKSSDTSIKWTPPIDLASQNTTGTSVVVTLTITTYNGNEAIGSSDEIISCAIPASVAPKCSLTVKDTSKYDWFGAMIKGYSKMGISVSAETAYGSDISLYLVDANGAVYNTAEVETDPVKYYGTLTVKATVVDKRGREGTATAEVEVLDYLAPVVTLLKVKRCNADGSDNEEGEYFQVTLSSICTPLDNKNRVSYTLEYKKTSETSYTTYNLSWLYNEYSLSRETFVYPADSASSYDVRVTITDDFTSTTKSTVLSTADTIMHFPASGKGMGIGKVCESDNTLDVGWDIKMNGHKITGLADPVNDTDAVSYGFLKAYLEEAVANLLNS